MVERVTVFRCQKCLTVFPRELQAVQGGPGSCRKSKRISRTPKPPFSAGRKIRSGITFRFAKHEKECKGALKWVCDECDQGFKQKGLLKRHKARTQQRNTVLRTVRRVRETGLPQRGLDAAPSAQAHREG